MRVFDDEAYIERMGKARATLRERGLDALVVFAPESLYYLFGYDGGGYVFFQCAIFYADVSDTTLICRRPDVAQARDTSLIGDIRVWLNAEDEAPGLLVREAIEERLHAPSRIGVEVDNHGCTGAAYLALANALEPHYSLEDGSDIVRNLRLIKSPAEIALIERAAKLADDAVAAVASQVAPGVLDSTLTAAALTAMLAGGGDVPPAGPLVNSGGRAVYGRGVGGTRVLGEHDQVMLEFAATYRRYNACIERIVIVGEISDEQRRMYDVVRATLDAMLAAFRPGQPLGAVDDIHRQHLDAAGYGAYRYAACGYSLGATYRPSWMDVPPMIYSGNPLELAPGMVFFPHVMLGDTDQGIAMGLGETVVVTQHGARGLSAYSLDPIVA